MLDISKMNKPWQKLRLWDVVTPGRIPRRGLVWSGGVWVGRWGGCGCGGLIGRVVWTVGWFLPAVPHPMVVWEVVVNTDCEMWSHRDGLGFSGVVWSGLVWSGGVWVGRWGGSGCGGLMGRVVWTVGWFLPAVPHPVVVWEVVVNSDCGMWSHRDGFPGVVWSGLVVSGWDGGVVPVAVGSWVGLFGPWGGSSRSVPHPVVVWEVVVNTIVRDAVTPGRIPRRGLVWFGGVWVGRWGGSGCGGLMGRVVWTMGWFLPVITHRGCVGGRGQHRLWDVVTPGRIPRRGLVWSGGVWVGRWGGSGCGGLMGRVVWTVGWFLRAVPHPVVGWEVVVNSDCGMWSHRDGFPGVVWSGLFWSGGVWVGRWGGSGSGGLPYKSGCLTVGWFLPAVPHPVVVWEVVVNTYYGMWSHRDGFLGVVWSGLVVSGWDGGVVPVAVGSWVGLFGPWSGSSRPYHTPWSCGRSWSTQIVGCGHTGTDSPAWSSLIWWCLGGTVGWFRLRWAHGSGRLDRGMVPPGRTTPRGRVGGRGQHRLWDVVTPGRIPRRGLVWSGLVWWCLGGTVGLFRLRWAHGSGRLDRGVVPSGRTTAVVVWEVVVNSDCGMWSHRDGFPGVVWSGLVVSGWDGGVVPVAVGSWVGLFGPWGGSSRPYHTPWSCGRSWSTQIVGCGHTGTDSPAWSGLVWWWSGWDGGVVPVAVGSWVGLFGPWGGSSGPYHTPWSCGRSWSTQIVGCGHTGTDSPAWSGLVWSGRWCLGGTVGWFRLRWAHESGCLDRGVAPPGCTTPRGRVGGRGQHRLWDVVTPGRIPRRGLVWSGLVGGVWVGRWGGSGCGGLMGRVVWTVGWFLPAVPHPVVVWEVVVNTDCGMWSHRDGFPGVVWSGLVWWGLGWDGGVVPVAVGSWVGLFGPWGGSSRPYHTPWSCGRSWSTKIVGCGHTGTDSPAWSGLVWSGGVWVGRWGGSGCGGLMGRVVWTVGWFLPAVPHPVVVWEVVVNTDCGMWSHRDGFPGVVWSGLVWSGGVWVGRWGGSGCGGLMGRVVWTVGWFLPAVPHPVVVWEVVVNTRLHRNHEILNF